MSTFTDCKSGSQLHASNTLVVEICGVCQCMFAMPKSMQEDSRNTGDWFWCPKGHRIHYMETTVQKLEKEIQQERQQKDQIQAELWEQQEIRKSAERSLKATKGVITRVKNRVSKGICPCCNRHFDNLCRHMKSKHPAWNEEIKAKK